MVLLGKKIKELRTKSKFTQSELANLLGVTKSSVASYENDSRQPSFSVLIKIAQIFNVSTDYLLLNKPEKNISIASLNEEQTEIIKSLIKTFTELGIMDCLRVTHGGLAINRDAVDCDYFAYRDGKIREKPTEYMKQYSFGEFTLPNL